VYSFSDSGIAGNRDLHLSSDFVAQFPRLQYVLGDQRILSVFDQYDNEARAAKRLYNVLGFVSVVLAVGGLEVAIGTLTSAALRQPLPPWITLLSGVLSLLAVLLIALSRGLRLREKWLQNVFVRERLRRWRHQILLNGSMMDMYVDNPREAQAALNRCWQQFLQSASVKDGGFLAYIAPDGSQKCLLFDDLQPPSHAELRDEIIGLQAQLRLEYQLEYSEYKFEPGGSVESLPELTRITDWVATSTLAGAVIVAMGGLIVSIDLGSGKADYLIAGVAAGLAILSAGTRALRSGLTIPAERDSYAEFSSRMQSLAEAFRRASDPQAQWKVLVQTETECADELRRFLAAKWHSRYIV
jgi:hypothetical protein